MSEAALPRSDVSLGAKRPHSLTQFHGHVILADRRILEQPFLTANSYAGVETALASNLTGTHYSYMTRSRSIANFEQDRLHPDRGPASLNWRLPG